MKTFFMILNDLTIKAVEARNEFEAHEVVREFTDGEDAGTVIGVNESNK